MGSRLATALHWFWRLRGPVSEGRHWMDSVLADGKDVSPAVHAALLARAGDLAMIQGDFARAVALQEASVALARKLDDRQLLADSLGWRGLTAINEGQRDRADEGQLVRGQHLVEQAVALAREVRSPF
jgi:hypothetical protein